MSVVLNVFFIETNTFNAFLTLDLPNKIFYLSKIVNEAGRH